MKVIAGTCKSVWRVASKWKATSLVSFWTMAEEIWRLQNPGRAAQHCLEAWAENIWKFQYSTFCCDYFVTSIYKELRSSLKLNSLVQKEDWLKKISKTRWSGDLRESKDLHHYCEVQLTFTTWKSLAANGLGSQGSHDCIRTCHPSLMRCCFYT